MLSMVSYLKNCFILLEHNYIVIISNNIYNTQHISKDKSQKVFLLQPHSDFWLKVLPNKQYNGIFIQLS